MAKLLRRLLYLGLPLLASGAFQQQAHAGVLKFYIFNDSVSGNATVRVLGKIDGTSSGNFLSHYGASYELNSNTPFVEINADVGSDINWKFFGLNAPTISNAGIALQKLGGTVSGTYLSLFQDESSYDLYLPPDYSSGSPIETTVTFTSPGTFTGSGLIASYPLANGQDTVEVYLSQPPATTPAPLPLLGGAAAFSMSRSIRRRIIKAS